MKYILLACTLLLSLNAQAETPLPTAPVAPARRVYAAPTAANLEKAMLRAGALDATHPDAVSDYLLINECPLYLENQADDFRLQKLKKAVGAAITQQRSGWPDAFYFKSPLQLDKYDFAQGSFMLEARAQLKNVNSFLLLMTPQNVCQQGQVLKRFPTTLAVRIDQPVTVTGLPLGEAAGAALLQSMRASGNTARQIYARFNIAVSYMPPFAPSDAKSQEKYVFDGTLASIEFFEDEELTKPIWVFTKN